jgi:hypothetical protein
MVSRSKEKRLTALVADRSSVRRNALAIGLARRGYQVRTARTPLEAIWTLESGPVDLFVLGDLQARRELVDEVPEEHPEVRMAVLRDESEEPWSLGEWLNQEVRISGPLASPEVAA